MKLSGSVPPWFFFIPKWAFFVPLSIILFPRIIFHTLCRICIPIWYENMNEVWNWLAECRHSLVQIHKKKRYNSKALSPEGCATAGDGNGCSQSRRAGSRGADINSGGPGRSHSPCSGRTHRASGRCGQHDVPHSSPGTVAGVGLAAIHDGLRRQPPRAWRRRPGPAFDPSH